MRSLPNGKQALKYLSTTCEQDFPRLPEKKKIMLSVLFIRRHHFPQPFSSHHIWVHLCFHWGARTISAKMKKWVVALPVPGGLHGLLCGYAASVKALTSLFCIFQILNERAAKELEQFQMRNAKLQQENEQHSLVCEQLSQENQQKALELKVNSQWHICSLACPFSFPISINTGWSLLLGALGCITCIISLGPSEACVNLQWLLYAQKQFNIIASILKTLQSWFLVIWLCRYFPKWAQMFISLVQPCK